MHAVAIYSSILDTECVLLHVYNMTERVVDISVPRQYLGDPDENTQLHERTTNSGSKVVMYAALLFVEDMDGGAVGLCHTYLCTCACVYW